MPLYERVQMDLKKTIIMLILLWFFKKLIFLYLLYWMFPMVNLHWLWLVAIIGLSTIMVYIKTPINATLCLCTILLFSIVILFTLHIEFMSYIFILVYVGGIVLLFLFVIIMLNLKIESLNNNSNFKLLSGSSILFLVILKLQNFISTCISTSSYIVLNEEYLAIKKHHYLANDILNFSSILYTHFFFYFLLIGIILLLAMLGVLVLSLNNNFSKKLLIKKNKTLDNTFILNSSYLPIENYISFSLIIFFLSLLGITINKQKNFLITMLFLELMLFSLSFLSIVISIYYYEPQGQIFSLFIMSIAVAESAIGLGILIALFRVNKRVDLNSVSILKG